MTELCVLGGEKKIFRDLYWPHFTAASLDKWQSMPWIGNGSETMSTQDLSCF